MAARFKMTGGDKLLRMLRAAPKEAAAEVVAVVKKEAEALVEAMRNAAPSDTGALRAAIRARYAQRGLVARVGIFNMKDTRLAGAAVGLMRKHGLSKSRAVRIASALGGGPIYARWIEFGTTKMSPRPYLNTTFRARRSAIRGQILAATVRGLKKAAR